MKKRMSKALWISLLAAPLYCQTQVAMAAGLIEAWRAATQSDKEYAVARAAHAAAQPRRDQAVARVLQLRVGGLRALSEVGG